MRHLKPILAAGLVLLASNFAAAQEDRSRVVAVNYPLQYFAQRLLGDAAEVVFPVPENVDPSFWRPSISDISAIQSADLILLNGAGFATWVDRVSLPRSKLVNSSAAFEDQLIVTESITHSHGDGGEHSHEGRATYVWLDPMLAFAQAEAIATAVITRKLAPAAEVEARLAALRSELESLDAKTRDMLAPLANVPMIATHPRYQYLARRYGLSMSYLEWEAGANPSAADIADLEALISQTGAKVLIWEAEPPHAAFDATAELGVQNTVFAPLAQPNAEQSFVKAMTQALTDLSKLTLN